MNAPESNDLPPAEVDSEQKAASVKVDCADIAFVSVLDSVSTLYGVTGKILHQLIGLEFRSGRAHDAHIEIVHAPERVPVLIDRMRRRWGAVAEVRETLPDNIPGLPHPERRTLVAIEIHTSGGVATAYCRVNRPAREIVRGALVKKGKSGVTGE